MKNKKIVGLLVLLTSVLQVHAAQRAWQSLVEKTGLQPTQNEKYRVSQRGGNRRRAFFDFTNEARQSRVLAQRIKVERANLTKDEKEARATQNFEKMFLRSRDYLHLSDDELCRRIARWIEHGTKRHQWICKSDRPLGIRELAVTNKLKSMRMLLENGAHYDKHWGTPLGQAAKHGCLEMVQLLLECGMRDRRSIAEALEQGRGAIVQVILDGIDKRDHALYLHYASDRGYARALKLLLDAGADVNAVLHDYHRVGTTNDITLLDNACRNGNVRMAEILLQYAPDTESLRWYGPDYEASDSLCPPVPHEVLLTRGVYPANQSAWHMQQWHKWAAQSAIALERAGLDQQDVQFLILGMASNPSVEEQSNRKEICSVMSKLRAERAS